VRPVDPADNKKAVFENRDIWNRNAEFWDQKMGEGNLFVRCLIRPAVERLLAPRPGQRMLDVACGNGLMSRWLAGLGLEVVAFDFSEHLLARARDRTVEHAERIDYRVADATRVEELEALGQGFDGALCAMALMDMPDIVPLFDVVARALKPKA